MYDFTKIDTDYLNTRFTFLTSLIEALGKAFAFETDSTKVRNLFNSLSASRQELDAINKTLAERAVVLPE